MAKAEENNKEKQARAQQKYMMLQMIEGQMKELQEQLEQIDSRTKELNGLKKSLSEFSSIGKGAKSFASVGMGVYAESEVTNTKEFLVNVGAGVIVKKPATETAAVLDKQLQTTAEVTEQMMQNLQALAQRASQLQGELQELVKE